MNEYPSISIVVPSFNQAQFVAETLQSLVDQAYPNLQVVIQDGGSTDGAVDVAKRFVEEHPRLFQLFVEKDAGQADALNRGFARATGEILGFLNSDDTLYPGVLHRVAREIDPARGRYVVMGRCLFVGENSPYVGVEHPAQFVGHFEQLAIWKRGYNTIPQPSVFWHRQVWERCGGFDVKEHHVLDYDLFCRISKRYSIHCVDELWSTYRMHDSSKSSQRSEAEVLDLSIATSRKYWGAWWSPLRWRCEASYWLYKRNLHEKARHHARKAEEAFSSKRYVAAACEFVYTALCSPGMARKRLLDPFLLNHGLRFLVPALVRPEIFTGQHGDGWIGPVFRRDVPVPPGADRLVATIMFHPMPGLERMTIELLCNGERKDRVTAAREAFVVLRAPITGQPGIVAVELRSSGFFIPRTATGADDDRKLSAILSSLEVENGPAGSSAAADGEAKAAVP